MGVDPKRPKGMCFCKDKTRDCLYCSSPFDPTWSAFPAWERFCNEYCKRKGKEMELW